jgi:peptidyl-prolyl cis-trans isomerase D
MFDLFRSREKSVRILLGVMLLLVAASMLVYLVPGGVGGAGASGENTIAAVGSDKITTADLQREIVRLTRGQTNLPKGILAMYVPNMVNQLIEQKAMSYKAREMGLTVSDDELGDAIEAAFAAQTGGKFDQKVYEGFLAQQGLTVTDFEKQQRDAMLGGQLETLERQALVVSDEDARAEYQRKNMKVGLEYLDFDGKDFLSKVNRDPAALKAYFDRNRGQFRVLEKRDVTLVVGETADFVQSAQVSSDELHKEYQDGIDSYRTPERVNVRHILIKTQGKPKEDAPKLKAKAEDLLKQIKSGAAFADLAKKNSEDPGSAVKGGELGWVVKGQTVPAFEQAAFSLKPGETSGVVETEYGYHILQVEEKQEAHTQSFEEAQPQLLMEAKKQVAADNLKKAVDAAHAEVLKNPAQSEAIAKKYNLRFFHVGGATNATALPEVNTQAELTGVIFALPKGGTTEVVNMDAQGKDAFASVASITPARNSDYQEVESDVAQKYAAAEAAHLAEQAAKTAADRARKGESLESLAKEYGLPIKTAAPFTVDGAAEGIGPASTLAVAFQLNTGGIVGPVSAQGGNFVCRVSQKAPADMTQFAANKSGIVQGLEQQRLQVQEPLFRDSIVSQLKARGKVKINNETINRIVSSYQS